MSQSWTSLTFFLCTASSDCTPKASLMTPQAPPRRAEGGEGDEPNLAEGRGRSKGLRAPRLVLPYAQGRTGRQETVSDYPTLCKEGGDSLVDAEVALSFPFSVELELELTTFSFPAAFFLLLLTSNTSTSSSPSVTISSSESESSISSAIFRLGFAEDEAEDEEGGRRERGRSGMAKVNCNRAQHAEVSARRSVERR